MFGDSIGASDDLEGVFCDGQVVGLDVKASELR
jgi:hypothetical protein